VSVEILRLLTSHYNFLSVLGDDAMISIEIESLAADALRRQKVKPNDREPVYCHAREAG
jgi:hypothetical protein